jgi:uncharacterized protein (DUF433 family)
MDGNDSGWNQDRYYDQTCDLRFYSCFIFTHEAAAGNCWLSCISKWSYLFYFVHCKNRLTIYVNKENHMYQLDRITQQPELMGGKACVRGLRVTVGMIVSQIGAGHSIDDVLADYPYLEREDVLQALRYAAWRAEEREVELS